MTKEKKNEIPNNVIEMTPDQLNEATQPGRVAATLNDAAKERLGRLLSGKEDPPNEFVAYMVKQLRAGNEEFRHEQQQIQDLNQVLAQHQRRVIQLQGEQAKYVQDITAWMDHVPIKTAGPEPDNEEKTDAGKD